MMALYPEINVAIISTYICIVRWIFSSQVCDWMFFLFFIVCLFLLKSSQWDNKLPEWTSGPGSLWGKKETISFLYISFCAEIRFYFKEMQTIPDMLRHNETTWDISVSGLVRDARCWNMEEWIKLCLLLMIRMQQIMWACAWGRKGNRCQANYPGQLSIHQSRSSGLTLRAPLWAWTLEVMTK